MPEPAEQILVAVNQLVDQVARLALNVQRLEERVEQVLQRSARGQQATDEPKIRPYDWVHQCTCSAGWVLDEEDGTAHRCPTCHPEGVPPANMS